MFKVIIIVMQIILLTGCAAKQSKTLFGKEGDTLSKSPCDACNTKPFYVDGRWVK